MEILFAINLKLKYMFHSLLLILFTYCLSTITDEFMNPNMILNWYYTWLTKIGNVINDELGNVISAKWFIYPIGFCKICTNIWLTFFICLFACLFGYIEPFYILPILVFSNYLTIKF